MVIKLRLCMTKNWQQESTHLLCGPFRWPWCRPGDTMPSALPDGAHPELHWKPLDAAIGWVFAPYHYHPSGCHGHQFWHKKLSCVIVKRVQKAQKGPSTQLIEATSCVESWNATLKAEELSYFSGYQMLSTDKNRWSYRPSKKVIKNVKSWRHIAVKLLTA